MSPLPSSESPILTSCLSCTHASFYKAQCLKCTNSEMFGLVSDILYVLKVCKLKKVELFADRTVFYVFESRTTSFSVCRQIFSHLGTFGIYWSSR